ncbi:reverse transcriptase domain-containing protein [Tanacetum coccineum]
MLRAMLRGLASPQSLRVDSKTPLVGFSREHSYPIGEVPLEITIGESPFTRKETLNFFIARSKSLYNLLLGRTAMQKMGIVVSTIQKFIRANADVFAWAYADMTGIPRTIMIDEHTFNTEHKLNEYKHIEPINQKRCGLTLERSEAACKEVDERRYPSRSQIRDVGSQSSHGQEKRQGLENGIKANHSKVQAITDLKPPRTLKEIQSLNGKLAALIRFLSKGADKSLPPIKGEVLVMYIAASTKIISAILLAERDKRHVLIYFVSSMLQGAELNYLELEKTILALIHATRRLRRFFQAHPIKVLTDKPIKQILARLEKSGMIAKWAIELGEHDIDFRGHNSVKGQILADFLAETPSGGEYEAKIEKQATQDKVPTSEATWKLYTDRA